HTRFSRDWSSDVCSSDLEHTSSTDFVRHFLPHSIEIVAIILSCALGLYIARFIWRTLLKSQDTKFQKRTFIACLALSVIIVLVRSEERRVGKECRSR